MLDLGRTLAACCAVALLVGLGAPVALASPLGQISEANNGLFFAGEKLQQFTTGPDGNLWFIDDGTEGFVNGIATSPVIGQITPSGVVKEYQNGLNVSAPTGGSLPYGLTSGPDGRVWFTDMGNPHAVGAITTTGQIIEYTAGLNAGADPVGIATGSDGNLWFGDAGRTGAIGKSTSAGQITEYTTGLNSGAAPHEVALGPDGNIWFTDEGTTPAIGKITPAGQITEYSSGLNAGAHPIGITAGPDGNLWFADNGTTPAIGRITTAGQIAEYTSGLNSNSSPRLITIAGDRNLWFTDEGATPAIGRITPAGQISEYSRGLNAGADPVGITAGPGDDLWFTDSGSGTPAIGQVGDGLPVIAFLATQPFGTSFTVDETVNPGGLPTTYYLEYGPTTAYGSSTTAQSAGDGDTPVTVTVTLPIPSTVLHFRFVATNAAGTVFGDDETANPITAGPMTTSPPPVFVPPPHNVGPPATINQAALLSQINSPSVKGMSVLVRLGCGGSPGQRCSGTVVLDTWEHLLGSQLIGLASRSSRPHRRLVTVGLTRFSIPAGGTRMVRVTLNRTGQSLLRRFGHLPAVLDVFGTGLRRTRGTVVTFRGRGS